MKVREQFLLKIQDAEPRNPVPVAPRLRRLLKSMLRAYGIRCVDIRPAESIAKPTSDKITGETLLE